MNITEILKKHFGYDSFRSNQEPVINSLLDGKDTIVCEPTGGGKSLCYQLPAICLDGVTLVISPLIALMKDQIDNLSRAGIKAVSLNSSISASEKTKNISMLSSGESKILYVSPEWIQADGISLLNNLKLSFVAVDEAHCISEWGHDFRKSYLKISKLRKHFPLVPFMALTATATPSTIKDISNNLALRLPNIFISSYDRPNLKIAVVKIKRVITILSHMKTLLDSSLSMGNGSTIIYNQTRKQATRTSFVLSQMSDHKIDSFHAGMNNELKKTKQDRFLSEENSKISSTMALGMGIDKSDVRLVMHRNFPRTIEQMIQEMGRGGRDGKECWCVMFVDEGTQSVHEHFISKMPEVIRTKQTEKLCNMIDFIETGECRRKYILKYFGEEYKKDNCGMCDNCLK